MEMKLIIIITLCTSDSLNAIPKAKTSPSHTLYMSIAREERFQPLIWYKIVRVGFLPSHLVDIFSVTGLEMT